MKSLFAILSTLLVLGIVCADDTVVRHKERTRTKTEVRSSCAGTTTVKATSCTGRSAIKVSAGCVGSSRTVIYSKTRTR